MGKRFHKEGSPVYGGRAWALGGAIEQLGLYVGSAATLQGDAVARVAIDSVTFTGTPTRADILFDTGLQALTKNTYNEPPGTQGPLWHP